MSDSAQPAVEACRFHDENGTLIVFLGADLTGARTAALWDGVFATIDRHGAGPVTLDLGQVERFDTSGIALAAAVLAQCAAHKQPCALRNEPAAFRELLLRASSSDPGAVPEPAATAAAAGIPVLIGTSTLQLTDTVITAIRFMGELALALAAAVRQPARVRWRNAFWTFQQCGADALPIVALICFLMGVIMAFQAAVQLHDFGADIYVADLVGLSITRELGPLMVAIIGAGRSGAAFAAEIGTMKVGEEVDAMVTMGLDPQRFLVVPKVLAMLIALPSLTLLGDMVGVVGGLCVGRLVLGLPIVVYVNETLIALSPADVLGGLFKSLVFAALIAAIGCFFGLVKTGNNARSVGRVTTATVVTCIFFIILTDAFFSILYHVLKI